ncbi:MAG: DUF2252 family protein [Methylocystis sp.]|uniref:DUF2252 family protein n=1 Tax=Methylocystis sp. TaxID=1911079 RepID=UPI003DA5B7CD
MKRLAASVAVAADAAQISKKLARALAAATVASYRKHMLGLAERSPLEAWNSHINLEQEMKQMGHPGLQRNLRRVIARARGEGLEKDDNFPRLAQSGELKIMDRKPTIFHLDPSAIDPARLFESYRQVLPPDRVFLLDRYQLKDLAFKAVGVGSVGTYCFIGLFASGDAEPLFLQVKEARKSVLEQTGAAPYEGHQGRRVVEGQRTMQAATDIFLGWTEDAASGRQFYIRRLKNQRLRGVSDVAEHEALADYACLCGRTLARAHARSGDPAMIAGYMGKGEAFDDAIASFATLYAERSIADYAVFLKARDAGFGGGLAGR